MWKTHNNNKGCAFGDYIRFFNKENMYISHCTFETRQNTFSIVKYVYVFIINNIFACIFQILF